MANWQATANMFSQLFDKPKMSEKLLQKPPFRYIFDIFQETTKQTGFAANLFEGEELNPSQAKEVKLQFLSKMKDLVQMMTGEELAVKPTRVIAGHEPENTNILLQTVYTLATSGKDSQPFVKKVLGKYNSESLKQGKMEEPAKPQEDDKEKQRQKKKQEQEQDEERKKMERRKQREQQKENERKRQQQQEEMEQQQPAQMLQAQPKQQMRPQSGYKKPPKIKDNVQVEEKQAKAGPKIIRENARSQQQDEDLFVEDNGPKNQGIKLSNIDKKRHGKFVNEALDENIDEQAQQQGQTNQTEEGGSKIKMAKVGQRGIKARTRQGAHQSEMMGKDDIETMTNLIQSICQNANPLGKSLEFLNDDIESMNKEREYWRKQFEVSRDKYQQEQRATEDMLQPLLDKNMQIDENIEEVKQKIQNTKAQIIKNTTIIQNLLFSVVQNKQQ